MTSAVPAPAVGDLPPLDHAGHRTRLRARLGDLGADAVLVTAPSDVRWLTGFAGSNGSVLLGDDPDADLLITDDRYRERVRDLAVPRVETSRRVP